MTVEQTRFLNSTVTSFNASLGWNDSSSQLNISLVDDPSMNDSFNVGYAGRPATFVFGDFTYTGIVQSYGDRFNSGGFTHEVTLVDPREFLDGVKLILDGYTGSVQDIPNLLNVYGYLESFGFGYSQKNETGIPWKLVRNSIRELTLLPQAGTYGGPLHYVQTRYIMDLSYLPDVPEDFRIGGDSISLLGFIQEVCEAGGSDFFISMTETTPGIFVIQVYTISRNAIINYGAVTEFLGSFSEYEDKSIGRELSGENSSKFLVGGPVREMWYQYGDASIATIWPFWGYDINGNPNIGVGYGNNHTVVLDSRSVNNPRVGPWYQTDVAEIRAVLGGRANWETFLVLHQGDGGTHTNKAAQFEIVGYTVNGGINSLFQELAENYQTNGKITLDINKMLFPHLSDNLDSYNQLDIETGYLYDWLYQIATEYYGKKFMVAIPYTYAALEPDTSKIRLSQIPVDSGFLDENLWPVAIQNNLLPLETDRFTEEDGQIVCFVRFDSGDYLDLSELSQDSVAFNSDQPQFGINKLRNYAVFVKANVANSVTFLDKDTQYGPRAVITLDGVVHDRVTSTDVYGQSIVADFLNRNFQSAGVDTTTPEYKENVLDKVLATIGADSLNYSAESTAVIPNLAVIPLESQVRFYGPWSSVGGYGKIDYEQDTSLVPWSYGGFTAMNVAANAKVSSAIGSNLQNEQGDITFPDFPMHGLGQAIMTGGPVITDISCTMGSSGASTTYKFRRIVKQPRYGQAKAARVAQIARAQQQLRRNMRLMGGNKRPADITRTKEPIKPITATTHPKNRKTSSHEVLAGQGFIDNDNNVNASVFLQADYNFIGHAKINYADKAFMSLDGLLRPFSTKSVDADGATLTTMPYLEEPETDASSPTVDDLNPFKDTFDTKLIATDYAPNSDLYTRSSNNNYRGLALRGPMMIAGWGYDTNGKPVPNLTPDDPGDEFLTEYKTDFSTWKVGPLDTRWDNDKKLWVAGGNVEILEGRLRTALTAGGTATMGVWEGNSQSGYGARDIVIHDSAGWSVSANKYVIVAKINNKYKPIVAEC